MAEAVFASLGGKWRFTRTLTSRTVQQPSGTASGSSEFVLRSHESRPELLQTEIGTFTPSSSSAAFEFTRRYVFALEGGDLNVYFAASTPPFARTYLFHRVEFDDSTRPSAGQGSPHQCSQDVYVQTMRFGWHATTLDAFEIEDDVRGPKKSWSATTEYTRAPSQGE